MNELKLINQQTVLGKEFKVYGTKEEPLFLAKDVAEWIDYAVNPNGSRQVSRMVQAIDVDEKIVVKILLRGDSQIRSHTMLTEDGLYEVLMKSTKPIAKQFKKEVKQILKDIRTHGIYITEDNLTKVFEDANFLIELTSRYKYEKDARLQLQKQYVELEQESLISKQQISQFMETENGLNWNVVAKNLGIGRNVMLKKLSQIEILQTDYYDGKFTRIYGENHNVPYQKYMKYFEVKYIVNSTQRHPVTYVKPEGQEFLRTLLATI